MKRRKNALHYAVKKSFSLPGQLYQAAEARTSVLGFGGFSDYIQDLIRRDVQDQSVPRVTFSR